jgi:hypothetical protein
LKFCCLMHAVPHVPKEKTIGRACVRSPTGDKQR